MADPSTYRPAPGTIPTEPGVYRFRDADGRVIYVGKAKNLRARLSNYFQDLSQLHPRTRQMVTTAVGVTWTVVGSEVEALQLEYTWIKKYDPRFNVKYRDDKSYPMLAVSVGQEFPRAWVYRGPQRKGVRYFGPYSHAWAIRKTLDSLIRVFPMRTCSQGVFRRHKLLGRPCLLGHIDKCAAPCVGRVSEAEHREIVDSLCAFLAGRTGPVVASLKEQMHQAAEELDFERAARLRDDLGAIEKVMERQAVVFGDGTDADVVGVVADELQAAIQVFHVRQGRIQGQRGVVVELPSSEDGAEGIGVLLERYLTQFYGDAVEHAEEAGEDASGVVPRSVLVSHEVAECAVVEQALAQWRGSSVEVRVPQRGDKRALMETVVANASESLRQHKLRRAGDLTARSAALQQIQDFLMLDDAPLRIECVDISHIQGTDVVASLVVFEDGLSKRSDYRRFKIREAAGDGHSNDVASIAEVTRRRFERHVSPPVEDEGEVAGRRRFAYPPNLYIVDGGKPQVNAAAAVLEELGVSDVAVVGLAKRLEEVWVPDDDYPVIFPRTSEGLFLLQNVRDEAHRFAITFHRQQRSSRMKTSVLDDVAGLGEARRAALIKHFGSVKKLREASVADIKAVSGFGPKLAASVFEALHDEGAGG